MAIALAPLMLMCGFVMAQPKIGPMGQLTAVYFTVGSNIDNVMTYNTVQFFNTSLAILFGIGVALVLFAIIFPETPSQALRLLRRQLRLRLSRFSAARRKPAVVVCLRPLRSGGEYLYAGQRRIVRNTAVLRNDDDCAGDGILN